MNVLDCSSSLITFPLAIVVSRFNLEVTSKLLAGAQAEMEKRGFAPSESTVAWVPGAVEIPLVAQRMAETGKYDAVIALGAVIRGETSHYDYVCNQVSEGCRYVMLEHDLPVVFGVLTTENEEQALARAGGAQGNKGAEAVQCAVEMVALLRKI